MNVKNTQYDKDVVRKLLRREKLPSQSKWFDDSFIDVPVRK
jgi:hypothetical protein